MSIGFLTLYFLIPGCASLKEKRGRIKPVIARLRREFNLSVAEVDRQDQWQESTLACALISNDGRHTQGALQNVVNFFESNWPDLELVEQHIELI